MNEMKKIKVFISHASEEKDLALAWKNLLYTVSMGSVTSWLSSDTDPQGGIQLGSQWRDNIKERLKSADVVLAIVSPKSSQRPWILWECGMAVGANQDERGLIPIAFSMKFEELGDPLGAYQGYNGDDPSKVLEICSRIVTMTGMSPQVDLWQWPIDQYLNTIHMYKPARAATREQVQTWSSRIDSIVRSGRLSELPNLMEMMYSSFGSRSALDATLHDTLSRLLLDYKRYDKALEEVDRAIELSSYDLHLYHRKALILLELKDYHRAKEQIDYIEREFKESAYLPEVAGAKGRLYRELGNLDAAINAYRDGYDRYKQSYYCGVNAVSLLIQANRKEEAMNLTKEVLGTCEDLLQWSDQSFWLDFTIAELYLLLGEKEHAVEAYQRGLNRNPAPSPRERTSALNGATRALESMGRMELKAELCKVFEG